MKLTRHKTPTEESFILWMSNNPESFHELDEKRFYQFARCIFSYSATKWLEKEYFKERILKLTPSFKINNIDIFYSRLVILQEYHEAWKINSIAQYIEGNGYTQRQVIDNEIVEVPITEEEYKNNGICLKEFRDRLKKKDIV